MRIAIVDDEITQLQHLRNLLSTELRTLYYHTTHIIDAYRSGQSFLDHWSAGSYDIIVLDIFMGGITGVDVAKKIRSMDQDVKLVFCSRSNEFAAESYQVNAQYYLVKPATQISISTMIQRLNLQQMQLSRTVTLPDGNPIVLRSILYTEYSNHVVTIYLKNSEPYRIRVNHNQIEDLLSSSGYIFSPSKGILVNFYEILQLNDDTILMSNQELLPVSRRRSKDFHSAYIKFRFEKMRAEVDIQ